VTSVLAAHRATDWNFPLLVHVLGAMILVGGLLTATSILAFARGNERFLRLGYWTLLAVAFPGWIVMFAGANWIYSKEGWDDLPEEAQPTWIGIGWTTALFGGLLLLISLIVGGIGMARLRADKGGRLLKATMVISIVLLAAYVVTVWAMAGKPD
jgi:hypothetical protein